MAIARISIDSLASALTDGSTIIVPNNRIRDAVLHAHGDIQGKRSFHTPKVVSIDVWVREIWEQAARKGLSPYCEKHPISTNEELFLWSEVVEASLDKIPLLNPEETASAVSRAYQTMKQWFLDRDHSDALEGYRVIEDISAFLTWVEQFQTICQQRQLISLADCLDQLNSDLHHAKPLPIYGKFILLNFYQPPPLYAELFDNLGRQNSVTWQTSAAVAQQPAGTHREYANERSEFIACCSWAKDIVENEPNAHIGLIGALNETQRSDLERVLANTLDPDHHLDFSAAQKVFNSTHLSHSLIDEGIIFDAFLLINLLREEQVSEDVCRLLRSPFLLAESEETAARNALESYLRRYLSDRCQTAEISQAANSEGKDYYCPALANALLSARELHRRTPDISSPKRWTELFENILESFGWASTASTNHQQRLLKLWQEALEQFSALSPILGAIDINKAISCLRSICMRSKYAQQFNHQRQISLYSIDEAMGLQFDHLWILNFNDQVWPAAVNPSPFLPYELQKEAGIPGSHSDIQHRSAIEVFRILCSSVSHTINSSHHSSDADQEYRASSFVRQFQQEDVDAPLALQSFYGDRFANDYFLITTEDDSQVPLGDSNKSLGGHQVLSDQSSCPFRAFALHRLRANPTQAFDTGLSKAARGSAMHRALEYLFKRITSNTALSSLSEQELELLCAEAANVATSFLQHMHPTLMTPRFAAIEHSRTTNLLQQFLTNKDAEAGREVFAVIGWEEELAWEYRGMHFSLVVDRIDSLSDGSLAVIDYKTGKHTASSASWLSERPEDLQIPFYFTVMSQQQSSPVQAVAIAHVNAAKTAYTGLAADAHFHTKMKPSSEERNVTMPWPELTEQFSRRVLQIADEFRAGITRVDPAKGLLTCRYCQLDSLCRIDELVATQVTGFDEDDQ